MRFLFLILLCVSNFSVVGQSTDTNYIDKDDLKQGYWQILGKDKKLPNYKLNQLIEEGYFVNSRKQGLWKRYYPNGNLKSKIIYKNSRPNGVYETYYENGLLEEKGTWKNNRNGYFERWDYNSDGCLDAWKYYQKDSIYEVKKYDTCNCLLYEILLDTVTNLSVYKKYENCQLIRAIPYTKEIGDSLYSFYNPIKDYRNTEFQFISPKPKYLSGNQKLYNANKQLIMEGFFKKNKLKDGKRYIYDENGRLTDVQLYKKGRYSGNELIPVEK